MVGLLHKVPGRQLSKKGRQLSKYHLLKLYQLSRMDSAVRRSTRVPQPSSKGKAVGLDAASTSNAKRSRVAETAARKKAEEDAAKLLQAEAAKRTRDKNKKDAADAAKKKAAALAKGNAAAAAQPRVAKKKTAVSAPGEAANSAQPQVAQVAQPEVGAAEGGGGAAEEEVPEEGPEAEASLESAVVVGDDVALAPGEIPVAEEALMTMNLGNPTWAAFISALVLKLVGTGGRRLTLRVVHTYLSTDEGGGGRLFTGDAQTKVDAASAVLSTLRAEFPNVMAEVDPSVMIYQRDFLDFCESVEEYVNSKSSKAPLQVILPWHRNSCTLRSFASVQPGNV